MKTSTLPLKAFLAVLVAIIFLPVGATAAAIAFTATGMLSILAADYGRSLEPVRVPAEIVPFGAPPCRAAALCEAA
jgi:hypothetical protein